MLVSDVAKDPSGLQKRVDRFVQSELLILSEFQVLLSAFRSYGKAMIFGGLIRDLALGHSRDFSSDIDIVVKDIPGEVLARQLSPYDARLNSFGGFRFQLGRWGFDVWPYDKTWAFVEGLIGGREIADLLRTTFFNWDAVLFDLETNELISKPSYFVDLISRRLAINLRHTPNELGAAVRALRLLAQNEVTLTPELAEFLQSQISRHGIHRIVDVDSERKSRRWLTVEFVGTVAIALQHHQMQQPAEPFALFDLQQRLPLELPARRQM